LQNEASINIYLGFIFLLRWINWMYNFYGCDKRMDSAGSGIYTILVSYYPVNFFLWQ